MNLARSRSGRGAAQRSSSVMRLSCQGVTSSSAETRLPRTKEMRRTSLNAPNGSQLSHLPPPQSRSMKGRTRADQELFSHIVSFEV
eukprot:658857-Amphidinium_carterae.1